MSSSEFAKHIRYALKRWDGLCQFLHDGRIEMDTNAVENLIRPVKLTEKNALFAGSDDGDRTWARCASLIGTYKLNDVNPQAYLALTLRRIVDMHPMSRIDDLMPWNFIPTILGVTPGQTLMAVSPPEPERWAAAAPTPIDTSWGYAIFREVTNSR